MAERKPDNGRNAARIRWIIILAVAGLGAFLFLRSRKSKASSQAAQNAVDTSSTDSGSGTPSVPTYSLSASGLYNGGYTPYTIINGTPGNFTSTFPGAQGSPAMTTSNTNSVTGAGITNSQTTTTYQ